jgi:hypothetical protein
LVKLPLNTWLMKLIMKNEIHHKTAENQKKYNPEIFLTFKQTITI